MIFRYLLVCARISNDELKKTTKLLNGSLNHTYIGPETSENTAAKSQIVLVLYALV